MFIDVPKSTVRTTSRLGAVLGRYCDAPDAEVSPVSGFCPKNLNHSSGLDHREHRKTKRGGLAGSGLGLAKDVSAGERRGDQ